MKKIGIVLVVFSMVFVGCSSTRTLKKDYDLINASSKRFPDWVAKPASADSAKNQKNYRYFVSESNGKNKRLCLRSAGARASARIAREIVQFIKNTYAEATQGGEDEEISEYSQEQLAQETQTFVVGARTMKTYWEKRRYKIELGAAKNEVKYACFALVKMSKRNLEKAVRHSRAKFLRSVVDPEVKKKVEKATAKVEKEFSKLNGPVKLDE